MGAKPPARRLACSLAFLAALAAPFHASAAPPSPRSCEPPSRDGSVDESGFIQKCLRAAEPGGIVALAAGIYRIDTPLTLDRRVTLTTRDALGVPVTCLAPGAPRCAELRASPALSAPGGFLRLVAAGITLDHMVVDGNRRGRVGSAAWHACGDASGNRRMGFSSAADRCHRCRIQWNAIVGTLCGSALEFVGDDAVISNNAFLDSGDAATDPGPGHVPRIADGLSITGAHIRVLSNLVRDATDQGIILFDGPGAVVADNEVEQLERTQPAYAGLSIDNSGLDRRGDFRGAEIRDNRVICGEEGSADRNCHFGIAIGSGVWHAPPIAPVSGPAVHGNLVRRARQGIAIEGAGVAGAPVRVWDNDVAESELEAWDGFIPAPGARLGCAAFPLGRHLTSNRSLNTATSQVCFGPSGCPPPRAEEEWHTDPAHADWRACY